MKVELQDRKKFIKATIKNKNKNKKGTGPFLNEN